MHNEPVQPRLFSDAHCTWKPRIIIGGGAAASIGSVQTESIEPVVPSLESLQRRHQASDQGWRREWLADTDDPCQPR